MRVSEGTATFTVSRGTLWQMHQANYRAYRSLVDKQENHSTIYNLLLGDGVSNAAISTLFGFTGATVLGAAHAIAGVVDYAVTSSHSLHMNAMLGGTDILNHLYDYCLSNNYIGIRFQAVCNTYTESDGTKSRFVRGNTSNVGWYEITGVQTSSGWIY
jgi:hypothetical protein